MHSILKKLRAAWKFFWSVMHKFGEHENALRAASLAYYGLFSIFPLLLLIIYMGSELLTTEATRAFLDLYLKHTLPVDPASLQKIIDQTIRARGSIGVVSGIGLMWSGSSVFGVLEAALSVIWGGERRPYWHRRFLATISVMTLSIVFVASFSLSPLTSWLWNDDGHFYKRFLNLWVSFAFSVLISFLLFRIFPNRNVPWRPALLGALIATLFIESARFIFDFYLALAFSNYGNVYGSLAWIVALGFWTYFVGVLFFLGAEFGAALELHAAEKPGK